MFPLLYATVYEHFSYNRNKNQNFKTALVIWKSSERVT